MKTLALAFLFVASAAVAADQTPFGIAGDPAKPRARLRST